MAALYELKATKVVQQLEGMVIHEATLQGKMEDRTTVFQFEHGTMIAIFDGHLTDELSEYASQELPLAIANRIAAGSTDIADIMKTAIENFDQSLLRNFTSLFEREDFSGANWDDDRKGQGIYSVVGYKGEETFETVRRAVVGSTALIAFINKDRTKVWVASLGDSDAGKNTSLCGRWKDEKRVPIMMSTRHNTTNTDEVQRILREHPNEEGIFTDGRLLGWLSVTRSLGDFQIKAPFSIASRGLRWLYRSPVPSSAWLMWKEQGHVNMPYMSSTPDIQCHELAEGDMLVFASDGLRDSMEQKLTLDERWDILISIANGGSDLRLQQECIPCGENLAESLIKNALFGADDEKMKEQMGRDLDDISVVIVTFK
ncbi:protein serine/threonine phosphatase 2C [Hymenopellis radicata]|nr:protein serine/threonine phosphatase 2C [Hymenopellis radicata]